MVAQEKAWLCTVCGYVHYGDAPPDICPVCGADAALFEPHVAEPAQPVAAQKWQCLNCHYQHGGDAPPDICPVCGAQRDRFEAAADEPAAPRSQDAPGNVVVIGGCIAGISAAEALRKACPSTEVTILTKETTNPYYRINLTRYLAGEVGADDLPIHPPEWYDQNSISLRTGTTVKSIAPGDGSLSLANGETLSYDRLVVAAGAHPFIPPFVGAQRDGVTSLRTREDADAILEQVRDGLPCACIGGGVLGLETAGALARRGADVTLLENFDWLMPRQLNQRGGEWLAARLGEIGIRLLTRAKTQELVGDEHVAGVRLEDETTIPAELVIIMTGVRPNSYLARRAGLDVNKGIVVDNHLCTSAPNLYAAGDVAEHNGVLYGNWSAAQYQGNIAGLNAAGTPTAFGGIPRSHTLKVLGLDVLSIGVFEPTDGSFSVVEDEIDGNYYRFVFRDSHLVGSILLGDGATGPVVSKAIESRRDFGALLAKHPAVPDILDELELA